MTNLEIIHKKLLYPSGFMFFPATHSGVPFPFAEWEIQDANGVGTGVYHSPDSLSAELPSKLLQLTPFVGGKLLAMRYGVDWDTLPQIEAYLDAIGLVNIRKNPDGTYKLASDLDYASFIGNEYMFVPPYQAVDIPK